MMVMLKRRQWWSLVTYVVSLDAVVDYDDGVDGDGEY